MPTLTIRNLPEEVHTALRLRAAKNGRSVEAEVRALVAEGVMARSQVSEGAVVTFEAQRPPDGTPFSFVGAMRGQFSMPSREEWKAMDKEIERMFLGDDE